MKGLVAFLGALVLCTCAAAQGGGWAAVQGISPGSRVEVRLSPPRTVKGTLVSVSTSGMEVQTTDGATRYLDAGQVTRVYLVGESHKLRDGLVGAGGGFAFGFIYDYANTQKYESTSCCGLVPNPRTSASFEVGALCAAIGAAVGAVIGLRHGKTLVYRREPGRDPGGRQSAGQSATPRMKPAHQSPAGGTGADPR